MAALDKSSKNYLVAYTNLYNQLDILAAQHAAKEAQISQQIALANKKTTDGFGKDWDKVTATVNRDLDEMVTGVLRGTQTWQQAFLRLGGNVVTQMAKSTLKMGVNWAGAEAKRLALELTTDQAMTDARIAQIAAGQVADASVDIKPSVLKHAGSAAAAVYDDVSQIPYVGWVLAPPAAAAAFAAVAAFSAEDGMLSVPFDGAHIIGHAQEMMLPASIANPMRNFFTDGNNIQPNAQAFSGGGSGGGGGIVINQNITVNAVDGPSVVAHANRYAPTYAKAVVAQLQRNPSLRGKY